MNKRTQILKKLSTMGFKQYGDMISDGKMAIMPICGMNWDTNQPYSINSNVRIVQKALSGEYPLRPLEYIGNTSDHAVLKYKDTDGGLTITKKYAKLLNLNNIGQVILNEDDKKHMHCNIMLTGLFLGDTVIPCIITESR